MGYHTFIQGIGHGASFSSQNQIASKTLVCYQDARGMLHHGFAYLNGSNVRVVCWENDKQKNKTIPHGASILVFLEEVTQKSFGQDFNAQDFNFPWFNTSVQQNAQNALIDWNYEQVVQGMAGLGIGKN